MKSFFSFLTFLFATALSFAQLSVSPVSSSENTYIYVKGTIFFVSGGVNLQKNTGNPETIANFYLREEAQLIQGSAGSTKNTGNGQLSVFQEGTSNAFDYNYWAAPVGQSPNNSFGIKLLYAPQTETKSTIAQITSNLDGNANPLSISARWIHTYSGTSYSDWNFIGDKTTIPPGYGFTMKGVNGTDNTSVNNRKNNPGNAQRYDFRGIPNNGIIRIPIKKDQNILVGNPYPSALDLNLFLLENSGSGNVNTCYGTITRKNIITGIAYFWDSKENGNSHYLQDYVGGYGAFSPVAACTGGVYQPPVFKSYKNGNEVSTGEKGKSYKRRFSPIGQGFMVKGASNAEMEFNNRQRIFIKEGNNSDFKAAETKKSGSPELLVIPKLRLEIEINQEYVRQLCLAFWETASPGTDIAMDAKAYSLEKTDVGWLQDSESYVIDVRPFREAEKIPLFLKVEEEGAALKLSIAGIENFSVENIFLYDTLLNIYHPLKKNELKLSLAPGEYHSRFQLCFQQEVKEEHPIILKLDTKIDVFQNNELGQLEVSNLIASEVKSISIFTLNGVQIFHENTRNDLEKFYYSTKNLTNSIYIVRIIKEDNSELVKKVAVFN